MDLHWFALGWANIGRWAWRRSSYLLPQRIILTVVILFSLMQNAPLQQQTAILLVAAALTFSLISDCLYNSASSFCSIRSMLPLKAVPLLLLNASLVALLLHGLSRNPCWLLSLHPSCCSRCLVCFRSAGTVVWLSEARSPVARAQSIFTTHGNREDTIFRHRLLLLQ